MTLHVGWEGPAGDVSFIGKTNSPDFPTVWEASHAPQRVGKFGEAALLCEQGLIRQTFPSNILSEPHPHFRLLMYKIRLSICESFKMPA